MGGGVLTIENPAKSPFTKCDILMGWSKFPSVTEFTASRDFGWSIPPIQQGVYLSSHQLVDYADNAMKIVFDCQCDPVFPFLPPWKVSVREAGV